MNNKSLLKNEKFYIKKRTMVRVAQQIKKQCRADVFIVVHKKDTDRIFSYTTDMEFDLSKVFKLVHRDVEERVCSKKAE